MRDILSMAFSVYYMICAEQADEKVRKVRGCLTVEHLRVSWNKGTTPYLAFLTNLLRPRLMRYPPRAIRIPRPQGSSYKDPVHAWLYFDGPISGLKRHNKLIMDVPGGGFVAMNPRNHDDKLLAWAGKTGIPVLALDYKKAPEFPYPYALNECFDVYQSIIATRGRCIGFSGESIPKIVVSGDSAGGNLVVGMTLMILQSGTTNSRRWQGEQTLPPPEGVILIYPALDMNIGNWMTDEQMSLIRDRRVRKTNQSVVRRKSEDYRKLTPDTPLVSSDEDDPDHPTPDYMSSRTRRNTAVTPTAEAALVSSPTTVIHLSAAHTGQNMSSTAAAQQAISESKPQPLKTRLAMSSMISYFNDRILSPEMMRAMIILYVGPHNRPDFSTDFLLSPLLAPEALLAKFPKTYFLTGERDPLVDDTVIFAGRIRQAKQALLLERKELGLERERTPFWEHEHVEVVLVPGISHGFLQFVALFPEGWKYIFRCARWMREVFERVDKEEDDLIERSRRGTYSAADSVNGEAFETADNSPPESPRTHRVRHHFRTRTESSGEEDRPLEMTLKGSVYGTSKRGRDGNGHMSRSVEIAKPMTPVREQDRDGERGRGRKSSGRGRRTSLVSLASEDDLLGRRMKDLAGSLMGDGPSTP
jgi:acetyl esterase/lipase